MPSPARPSKRKLSDLSKAIPPHSEIAALLEFSRSADGELKMGDRHAAIVASAAVEHGLRVAITTRLSVSLTPGVLEHFFTQGVAGSFGRRIDLAMALGIVTAAEAEELRRIKNIRNQFAHALEEINFDDPTIVEACEQLFDYPIKDWEAYFGMIAGARRHFIQVCLAFYEDLAIDRAIDGFETRPT